MGQNTQKLYYAGVGSRETPVEMQTMMTQVAHYLQKEGWILRSGAATGADSAFEKEITNESKEIYLPWAGYNNHPSEFHPKAYPFTQQEQDFTAWFHPAWSKCSPSARLLHQRNTRIILGCESIHGPVVQPVKFVVCWTQGGQLKGGTAQAIRIAQNYKIPVVNFGLSKTKMELENQLLEIDAMQMIIRKEMENENA
jgi:hypothetical protein